MLEKAKRILFLRIAIWIGAIMDLITAVDQFGSAFLGNSWPLVGSGLSVIGDASYQYAMLIAAVFMLAWTILLLWADRKPLERRGVVLQTVIPVLAGLVLSRFFGYSLGIISESELIFTTIIQSVITFLFLTAYILTRPSMMNADKD